MRAQESSSANESRGTRGCARGKKRRTTRRDPRAAPHRICLAGTSLPVGQVQGLWLADITYIPTREGFLYLAFILDTHSRRVVGWSMDSHMRTELVVDALEMTVWRGKPSAGLVHHSDRGVQKRAISFGKRSKRLVSFLRWGGPERPWTT
jgi:putative transposase